MDDDLECPYCGKGNEVCHDDGQGYDQSELHEMQCRDCNKFFVFKTSIFFSYEPLKADCLNDSEHNLAPSNTTPKYYTKMKCTDCDYERNPTAEEKKRFSIPERGDL